jgi:hypothetical protein
VARSDRNKSLHPILPATKIVILMKQRKPDTIITENQVIKSKVTSEKVLSFALNLGMLSTEHHKYMKAIGKSKQVGELMQAFSITDLEAIKAVLRKMQRRGLIAIVENT